MLDAGVGENGKPLNRKDREILRNRISAQNSRQSKKSELAALQEEQKCLKTQCQFLISTLASNVSETDKDRVRMLIYNQIPDKAFLETVPEADRFSAVLNHFLGID